MAGFVKRALVVVVVAGVAIQLVRIDRTNPAVETEIDPPEEVAAILDRACYDCHSNETRWPWYSLVAPVSWLVAWDVREARRELNFSTWNRFKPEKQAKKLEELEEEVEEGHMPLWYYRLVHWEANLTDEEKETLFRWAREERKRLPAE